ELNQHPTAGFDGSAGALTIDRTAGDLLITYDYSPSKGTTNIGLLRWLTTGNGDDKANCFSANSLPCWGSRVDMTGLGFAEAKVNAGQTVTDPYLPAPGTLTDSLFGEASLNLSDTQLHVFEPNTCKAFGDMFVK